MTNPEQNPYGQPSHQPAPQPYGQPGQPAHPDAGQYVQQPGHPGYPGQPPEQFQPYQQQKPRKRQLDADPGRFTWWDAGATLLYVLGFLGGGLSLVVLSIPAVDQMLSTGEEEDLQMASFLGNAISYGTLGLVALVLSFGALVRSIRTFAYLWWLKLLLIPVIWVGILIFNAVMVMVIGEEPQTSQNQESIETMLGVVPFVAALVVIALLGPYVEEYFFRHLLIGKLSRHVNIWLCAGISVITFPLLHFLPSYLAGVGDLNIVTFLPYLTMGLAFTLAYILTGRSLIYAWLLHAFNNVMSLLVTYYVMPWAEEMEEELEQLEQAGHILRVVLIGA